jgi:hypothetical protein
MLMIGYHYACLGQMFVGADKKSRVYQCTMKQNRKPCAVLFEEHEYEQAVLEAY